jgi:hypothetical protein
MPADMELREASVAKALSRQPQTEACGCRSIKLGARPSHHFHRAALVHRHAHQLARGIEHFPKPASLLALDRVAGLRAGGGSLGLALIGHCGLRSS